MILDDFIEWHDSVRHEIQLVAALLHEHLSDEAEKLIGDLQRVEAWNGRCGLLLAEANSWLDRAGSTLMPAKEQRSETDRRLELEARLSPIRVVRDRLESLCNSIKQRLILGESILSYQKQFADRKQKESIY